MSNKRGLKQQQKRPGVQAGVNLVTTLRSVQAWEVIEGHGREVVNAIPHLVEREESLQRLAGRACAVGASTSDQPIGDTASILTYFTKSDLDAIVLWKHTVGKNRIYNIKYLNANGEDAVRKHSQRALQLARQIQLDNLLLLPKHNNEDDNGNDNNDDNDDNNNNEEEDVGGGGGGQLLSASGRALIQEPLAELGKLKGVGPATASAILSLIRPDIFCYLYDEVIDCFEPQRDYKMSNYLRVNGRCLQLAHNLGGGSWTAARVAKTIWIAARYLALHGRDPTVGLTDGQSHGDDDSGDDNDEDDDDDDDADEEDDEDHKSEDESEGSNGDNDDPSADDKPKNAKRQRTRK